MADPLQGFKPVKDDPLAGFKPVEDANVAKLSGPSEGPVETQMTSDELVNFFAGGGVPDRIKRQRKIRQMPRSLISTPEDLADAYGIDKGKISPADLMTAFQDFKESEKPGGGAVTSFLKGLKRGVTAPLQGAEQAVSRAFAKMIPGSVGLQSSAELSDLQARIAEDQYRRQTEGHGLASGTGRALGELPYAVAVPGGPISGSASKIGAIGRAALGGGLLGASQPISDPYQSRMMNALTGATVAPVAQIGMEGLVGLGTKAAAAARPSAMPAQYAALESEAAKRGLTMRASDLVEDPASFLKLQTALVRTAPLSGLPRQEANNTRNLLAYIRQQEAEATGRMISEPVSGESLLRSAAAGSETVAKNPEAVKALKNLDKPLSPGASAQADIIGQKFVRRAEKSRLYGEADKLAPTGSMDTQSVIGEIDELLKPSGLFGKNKVLSTDLKALRADLQGQTGADLDVSGIDRIIKIAREKRTELETAGKKIDANNLGSVIERLNAIKNRATNAPENAAYAKAKAAADQFYGEQYAPYEGDTVKKMLEEAPDRMASMWDNMTPDETAELVKLYGPKAKRAHYLYSLSKAIEDGLDVTKPGAYQVDRNKIIDSLNRHLARSGQVATGMETASMRTTVDILQHMSELGNTNRTLPTWTNVIWRQPAKLLDFLQTTDAGKRFVLTLSASKTGSPTRQKVLQQMEQIIPRLYASDLNAGQNPVDVIPEEPTEP